MTNCEINLYRARGVTYRKESAVAGFFSQIGQLYVVHHIWGRCFS